MLPFHTGLLNEHAGDQGTVAKNDNEQRKDEEGEVLDVAEHWRVRQIARRSALNGPVTEVIFAWVTEQ